MTGVIYQFFIHVHSLPGFSGKCKRLTYFLRSHLSAGPEARERRLPATKHCHACKKTKTERDSSTNLLIDLLRSEFAQRRLLHEPDEPRCCGNLCESFILWRLVDGSRREESVKINTLCLKKKIIQESPVKLASWMSFDIRFVSLVETICIADDSSRLSYEAQLYGNTCLWNG